MKRDKKWLFTISKELKYCKVSKKFIQIIYEAMRILSCTQVRNVLRLASKLIEKLLPDLNDFFSLKM